MHYAWLWCLTSCLPAAAGSVDEREDQFIQVNIRGVLHVGSEAEPPVKAITVTAGTVKWELSLGDNKRLQELAQARHGKMVRVRGFLKTGKVDKNHDLRIVQVDELSTAATRLFLTADDKGNLVKLQFAGQTFNGIRSWSEALKDHPQAAETVEVMADESLRAGAVSDVISLINKWQNDAGKPVRVKLKVVPH